MKESGLSIRCPCLAASPLDSSIAATPRVLVLQREPARRQNLFLRPPLASAHGRFDCTLQKEYTQIVTLKYFVCSEIGSSSRIKH